MIAVFEHLPLALNLHICFKFGTRLSKFHSILDGTPQTLAQDNRIDTLILVLRLHTNAIQVERFALFQLPQDAENSTRQ